MSPWLRASADVGKLIVTVCEAPALSVTRANPTSRWGGSAAALSGWATYSGTTSVPSRLPVLATVSVAVTVPWRETDGVTVSAECWNVV